MDYALFAIVGFFLIRGFFKGSVSMFFSLFGIVTVALLSWKIGDFIFPRLEGLFRQDIEMYLKGLIDDKIPGIFSEVFELKNAVSANLGVFGLFIFKLLGDITFEGSLTAGQILAPSISGILLKVIVTIVIFIILEIIKNILKKFFNKFIISNDLSWLNRFLGAFFGLLKGFVVFGVFYIATISLANTLLNEKLLDFVQQGYISKLVYENFIVELINFFYAIV